MNIHCLKGTMGMKDHTGIGIINYRALFSNLLGTIEELEMREQHKNNNNNIIANICLVLMYHARC